MSQLTPEQRRQAERFITRAAWAARATGALVFALLLAAIWLGDWRYAATAGLVLPIAVATAALAGRLRKTLGQEGST